jgi:hypothetical protein
VSEFTKIAVSLMALVGGVVVGTYAGADLLIPAVGIIVFSGYYLLSED